MALLERVQADMVAAMKARDEARLSAIRMIKAALQKQQIDSMKPLDEAGEQATHRLVSVREACLRRPYD